MRDDGWHALLFAAAVAGGVALGGVGSATGGPCEATRRGAELLREGRSAEALRQLAEEGAAADGCEQSTLRAYNRALAHARIGRAAGDRSEAVRHLERASRGFGAVLARDSAEDARWNRALVGDWLDRLARESAGGPGAGSAGRPEAGGGSSDTANAAGAGAGPAAGRNAGADERAGEADSGFAAADAGGAGADRGTRGGGGDGGRDSSGDDPTDAGALEGLLRDASASDRRLRGLVLRRALVADVPEAGRW